jgi:hypothetical protein
VKTLHRLKLHHKAIIDEEVDTLVAQELALVSNGPGSLEVKWNASSIKFKA